MPDPAKEINNVVDPEEIKKEILSKYPTKVARKREKQIAINKPDGDTVQEIGANVRTIPGIITQRGCTYAGCKGVVLGPTRDISKYNTRPDRVRVLQLADQKEPDRPLHH